VPINFTMALRACQLVSQQYKGLHKSEILT